MQGRKPRPRLAIKFKGRANRFDGAISDPVGLVAIRPSPGGRPGNECETGPVLSSSSTKSSRHNNHKEVLKEERRLRATASDSACQHPRYTHGNKRRRLDVVTLFRHFRAKIPPFGLLFRRSGRLKRPPFHQLSSCPSNEDSLIVWPDGRSRTCRRTMATPDPPGSSDARSRLHACPASRP